MMIRYCINCIWCRKESFMGKVCVHPDLQLDLDGYVDGRRYRRAEAARTDCGKEGKFFKQRPKSWMQRLFRRTWMVNDESK